MSNRLLFICLLMLSGCHRRVSNEMGIHDEVSLEKDSVREIEITPALDTTSESTDSDSMNFFLGEPCFTTPPKEVGHKIDSLVKTYNGLKCLDGESNVVFVEFLVDSIGSTSDFKIAKTLCPRLNTAALKIVRASKFEPAYCGSRKIQMRVTYKLNFE